MGKITIIAAIGKNRELGKNNDLIWHLKEDLKFFKEATMNHKVVMGYNTYLSLPKTLPGREYIILCDREVKIENAKVFHDFKSLLDYIKSLEEDVFIIGGASIYRLFINYADELLLTEIDAEEKSADVYFPEFNKDDYEKENIKKVNEEEIIYEHVLYRRK